MIVIDDACVLLPEWIRPATPMHLSGGSIGLINLPVIVDEGVVDWGGCYG